MSKIRSSLIGNLVLPAGDLFFRQGMMKRLKFLREAQWWSRERLAQYRDESLRSLVRIAYEETAFYRQIMDDKGVHWTDIRTVKDLPNLPVVTKDMLRANYGARITRPTGLPVYEAHTSGSSGTNFKVAEDSQTAGHYRAAFLLSLIWAGWEFGDRHLQVGMTDRNLQRRLKDWVLNCHYVSAFDVSDKYLDSVLDQIERHRIEHVWGYPGSLFFLARRARHRGWNRPVKSIVTWADNLYPHYRNMIEGAFQRKVLDTYGCGEGMQMSTQCNLGEGYHIHMTDSVVEYVDSEGRPVPDGQPGELLITRLHPGPTPLIRYQIGDVGVSADPSEFCPCGRQHELMKSIQGRDTDVILTPSGNRLIVHFITLAMEFFEDEVDCYQVVQSELESILIRVKMFPHVEFTAGLAERIAAKFHAMGVPDLKVNVEPVAEIPPTRGGKRRFVISELAANSKLVASS